MTMQSTDYVIYRGEDYAILRSGSGSLFHPEQVGIVTEELHTACYRGYQCTYEITDHTLFLGTLEVRARDGRYPFIHDTHPSFPDGLLQRQISRAIYHNIGLPMPYTGTMRLGKYPDHAYEPRIFYYEDWAYRRVLDAVFVDGRLRSVADLSEAMAQIRAEQPKTARSLEDLAREFTRVRNRIRKPQKAPPRAAVAKKRKKKPRTL